MKAYILQFFLLFISTALLAQEYISVDKEFPTEISLTADVDTLNYRFSLTENHNGIEPTCSRNYSGKNLYFKFDVPNSGILRIEILHNEIIDHGIALYSADIDNLLEIACSQSISGGTFIQINDTTFANSEVLGRIWINSDISDGDLSLRFITEPYNVSAKSPVITVSSASPEELVNNVLISGCVQASNIQFTGHPESIGFFTNGVPGLDFNSGIILSTGRAVRAAGPNTSPATSSNLQQPGDSVLTAIINRQTYDAAILEFDFIPSANTISFQYVFGSEEYEEYVGGVFNDIFAFHISGGPENYQNQNLALIPGTQTPVSINNVNHIHNTTYYNNNDDGIYLQFDGYTKTLTAIANVTPCESYHIRLAIADAADPIFDSGVFLKAGSFSSGTIPLVKNTNGWVMANTTYEGCDNNLMFVRSDNNNIDTPLDINIQILGNATMGVDYSNIPFSFQIPAGEESLSVPYQCFIDSIDEGEESFIIRVFTDCNCGDDYYDKIISIRDKIEISGSIINYGPKCSGDSILISLDIDQLPEYYHIEWSTGHYNELEINAILEESGYVTAEFYYPCGVESFSTWVDVMPLPEVTAATNAPLCEGYDLIFSANNDVDCLWKGPGGWFSTDNNPTISLADLTNSGTYGLTVTGDNGCKYIEFFDVQINTWPEPILPPDLVVCQQDNINISPGNFYAYQWSGPNNWTSASNAMQINSVLVENAGLYSLIVSDEIGCTGSAELMLTVNPAPVASIDYNYPICENETLSLVGYGVGNAIWTDPLSNIYNQSTLSIEQVGIENSGVYNFKVENEFGCTDSVSVLIEVTIPDATIMDNGIFCMSDHAIILNSQYLGGIWSGAGIVDSLTGTFIPSIAGVGSHTINYEIGYEGCSDVQSILLTVEELPELELNVPEKICSSSDPITLIAEPQGGLWYGSGIIDNSSGIFDPAISETGIIPIIYNVNLGACNLVDTVYIEVIESLSANILPIEAICNNSDVIILNSENIGGIWSGNGIINQYEGSFNPALTEPGIHTVYYSIFNEFCSDIDSLVIFIDEYISSDIICDTNYCLNNQSVVLESTNSGGNWSGYCINEENGLFTPNLAGNGIIYYTLINGACVSVDSIDITVSQTISADFYIPESICQFDSPIQFFAENDGGFWTGAGIVDSLSGLFNPAIAQGGLHSIIYTTTNGACQQTLEKYIEVLAAPDPFFESPTVFCVDQDNMEFVATTIGGVWSGCGFESENSNVFNPTTCGSGEFNISYSISNDYCISVHSKTIYIYNGDETITLDNLEYVCPNSEIVMSASPAGGVWTGNGVGENNTFSSQISGQGFHEITYTIGVSDCMLSASTQLFVPEQILPEMLNQSEICQNAEPILLQSNYEEGIWSGNFVENDHFISQIADTGYNLINFEINIDNCDYNFEYIIYVKPVINPLISGLAESFCQNFGFVYPEFMPAGGLISGMSLNENNSFSTEELQPGFYEINYTIVNENSCQSTYTKQFEILEVPEVIVSGLASAYCINSNDILLHATPWGGQYEGVEISGSSFSPSSTGIGEHLISYSYAAPNGCTSSDLHTVFIYGLPEISFSITNPPSCNNTNDVEIFATINAQEQFQVFWNNSEIPQSNLLTGATSGWNYITVIGSFCEISDSIFVEAPAPIAIEISGTTNLLCGGTNNGLINVFVSGGVGPYQYLWNNESFESMASLSGLGAGEYYLTVIDSNNCTASATHQIFMPSEIQYQIIQTEFNNCFGDNNAVIEIISDQTELAILWDDGSTEFVRASLSVGTYYFTVSNQDLCSNADSVIIDDATEIIVISDISNVMCGQYYGGIITGTSGGVSPYSFEWSNGSTISYILNVPAGNYILTVTDSNNCMSVFEFEVETADSIDANIQVLSPINCYGSNTGILQAISLVGTQPLVYEWSGNMYGEIASDLFAGDYQLTITDNMGCVGLASISLDNPAPIVVNANLRNVKCKGESTGEIQLNCSGGTGDLGFLWNNGSNEPNIIELSAGEYIVTITDLNLCTQTQSFFVSEPEISLSFFLDKNEPSCNGYSDGSLNATAVGGITPYQFSWQYGGYQTDSKVISGLYSGSYVLKISDGNNCKISETIELSQPELIDATILSYPVSCNGNNDGRFVINASGGVFPYDYFFKDTKYSNSEFNQLIPGEYQIQVMDNNNCLSDIIITTIGESDEDCIEVPNAFTPNGDGINDTWDIYNIDMYPNSLIQVYNKWGQIVFSTISDNEKWDGRGSYGELPSGTYIYIIDLGNRAEKKTGSVNIVR
jgi:gliding motility-associated-like protein